jgi:hypothetical protein
MNRQTWRGVLIELAPRDLIVMSRLCMLFYDWVITEYVIWDRHVKRVLQRCPRVSELLVIEPNPYNMFRKFLFPPFIETLKRYHDHVMVKSVICESVYRLRFPNMLTFTFMDTGDTMLFACTFTLKGVAHPQLIMMSKRAVLPFMSTSVLGGIEMHSVANSNIENDDDAFRVLVFDNDGDAFRALVFHTGAQ